MRTSSTNSKNKNICPQEVDRSTDLSHLDPQHYQEKKTRYSVYFKYKQQMVKCHLPESFSVLEYPFLSIKKYFALSWERVSSVLGFPTARYPVPSLAFSLKRPML